MMIEPRRALLSCLGVALASGCAEQPASRPPSAPREVAVYTTFYPTTYFVERVAHGAVPVVCPLPDDVDPISWIPPATVIGRYQRASLIVVNGAGFEKWVPMASLPDRRVVDASGALPADALIEYDTTTHSHGLAGDHTHDGIDGHVWLDPTIARMQVARIADAMTAAFPEHATVFAAGRAALDADLVALGERLEAITPRVRAARVLCSHPAYNYLDRRYAWGVTNLDLDPDAPLDEATHATIAAALAGATGDGPAIMLWESTPPEATADDLRTRHAITSVTFSPCETPPPTGDYLTAMQASITALEESVTFTD